jgi:hypothetical protein
MAEISIGDVILIFISAFGGAWANSRFRGREAKKAEKEERNNLVFLIDTEVGFNAMRLGGVSKGLPFERYSPSAYRYVWDASQARLAHLLPTGDMKVLASTTNRYACLRNLMTSQPKMIRASYRTANGY